MLRRVLVALLLAVPLVAIGGTAEAAACSSSTTGVTVVVQFPDNHTEIGCAAGNPSTGDAALRAAGFTPTYVTAQPFVCRINGAPASASCAKPAPADSYWAYFHAKRGGTWAYSSEGATSYDPPPGSVEGWRFGGGAAPTTKPPGSPAPSPKPSPKPTPKPSPTAHPTAGSSAKASAGPTASAKRKAAKQAVHKAQLKAKKAKKAIAAATADASASPETSVADSSRQTSAPTADTTGGGSLPWWWGAVALVLVGGAAGGVTLLRETVALMSGGTTSGTRDLHPVAWWGWAIGVAVAASLTTNPLLLGLLFCSVWLVVANRRGSSPWARAFRLYVILGGIVIASRIVFHVLIGFKYGVYLLFHLPSIPLPHWAAGIQLGGDVYLEGLIAAACLGMRLAVLIIAIGAANALANPKRLLRSLPRALHELGTAVVVSVSVAPQLAESVQRVMRARHLRGEAGRGFRAVPRVALPVLQDTLDRSLLLASAMESRGYGSHTDRHRAVWLPGITLGGLVAVSLGMYGVLDSTHSPLWMGFPVLVLGIGLCAAGIWLSGRAVLVTVYRPDPWRLPETLTVLCGIGCAAGMLIARQLDPASMDVQTQPLSAPVLPAVALVGILVAALPAVLTPRPTRPRREG